MRAVIVSFFNYQQGNEQLLWKFFLLHAAKWEKYVDKIYAIDSGCGLENSSLEKIQIIRKPAQSHWQNMNEAIREIPEDLLLLLDSDMIIYDPEVVKECFEAIENKGYDAVAILDSSGSIPINDPRFKENENRFERRRICPYLCFIKKSSLRENFDFTPRGGEFWTDSMGVITEQFVEDRRTIIELPDDRSTISLEDNGRINSCQWLDTPPKKWSMTENPNYGYYHIRNFGGGLKIVKEGNFGLVPGREARRLLAWVYTLADAIKTPIAAFHAVDVDNDTWNKYYKKFQEYHSWLKNI